MHIFEIEKQLLIKNEILNFENFKKEYLGIKEHERLLIPIFSEHNRKIK